MLHASTMAKLAEVEKALEVLEAERLIETVKLRRPDPRNLKLAKRHQLDFHVGVGLSSAAVDHFVGIGYSFRFQAIRHK